MVFSLTSDWEAASNLRSVSIPTISSNVSIILVNLKRFASTENLSRNLAAKKKSSKSLLIFFFILGLSIFNATSDSLSFTFIVVLCTWAIEAADLADSMFINISSKFSPNSSWRILKVSFLSNGGSWSWRFLSFSERSWPMISGRVDRNCPNFIQVGPSFWRVCDKSFDRPILKIRSFFKI